MASASTYVRSFRLGGRTRKAFLVVHIASAGAWIGLDVVMGILVFTALLTDDDRVTALCFQALDLFAVWPLLTTGVLCLASGVVLGLGSKYGLVRYWWVAVKLVLNLTLCTLVLVALRPGVHEVAVFGQQLAAEAASGNPAGDTAGDTAGSTSAAPGDAIRNIVFPPVVSTSALLFAVVLSVYKPWGRIRRGTQGAV